MDNVGYAALQIIPSFDGFQGRLERGTSGPLSRAGTRGGTLFGNSAGRSLVSSMSTHAKRAGLLAAGILSGAVVAGGALLKASFAEADEALKVGRLTESTIKATGAAANISAKQVGNLAGQLSLKAGVDDEVIQSGLNMLLTFKNVRNEVGKHNKVFNQAAKVTTDMAAAMAASSGGELDLKSASIQVGKALNDPIKGITALSRVGVTFTDQQKANIKALVDQGDTMAAQKIIIHELKSEFGGAAESQATAWDRLKVAWGNAEEKLGTALLPTIKDASRFMRREGIPAITDGIDLFETKGVPALKHFYEKAKPVAEDLLPKLADILGIVKDDLAAAAPYAKDLVDAFLGMPDWAKKVIVGGGLAAFAANKTGLLGAGAKGGSGLLSLASKAKPIPVFVTNEGFGGPGGGPGSKLKGPIKTLTTAATASAGPAAALVAVPAVFAASAYAADKVLRHFFAGDYERNGKAADQHRQDLANENNYIPASYGNSKPGENPWQMGIDQLNKQIDAAARRKIQPTFEILGLVEADAKVARLREKAERPIRAQLILEAVANIDQAVNAAADAVDGFFGSGSGTGGSQPTTTPKTQQRGGVTVNIDKVMPHNYRDFMHQTQQRAQQAGIGAIGALP